MSAGWKEDLRALRERFPGAIVGARVEAAEGVEKVAVELVAGGIDIIHLLYDEQGQEKLTKRRAKDSLLSINKALAAASVRENVSIIAAGGLAAAEHVPKSIICGADAIVLEQALKVALGCHGGPSCPVCPMDGTKITHRLHLLAGGEHGGCLEGPVARGDGGHGRQGGPPAARRDRPRDIL